MSTDQISDELTQVGEFLISHMIIKGLHKRQDITLSFAGRETIFIADNGSGKTTSLFILNCLLTGNLSKLKRFDYDSIVLSFRDGNSFTITPEAYARSRIARSLKELVKRTNLKPEQLLSLAKQARHSTYSQLLENSLFLATSRLARYPSKMLHNRLIRLDLADDVESDLLSDVEESPVVALRSYINERLKSTVIYLPTYRRVEQEIEQLIDQEEGDPFDEFQIHFGMRDIRDRISTLTDQIRDHFIHAYGEISGQLLGYLVEDAAISDEMRFRLQDRRSIEIVLERSRENISASQKTLIMSLFDEGTLLNNKPLSFFMARLIEAYDEVRKIDTALFRYAEICNGYLINKSMKYDSLNASLYLQEDVTEAKLDLEYLSSGEKQI